jgi:hypothetical protein
MYDIPLLLDSVKYFFISLKKGPTDLLHSSPAPHFKTFQILLIYFPKCPGLDGRTTLKYVIKKQDGNS